MLVEENKLKKFLWGIITFKFFYLIGRSFAPFTHPHIIRQTDTLSVALRYWLRWTQEPFVRHTLLPAVLSSGDNYGITPMEFPILNLILAPIFSLGLEWGRGFAFIAFILITFSLSIINYRIWRNIKIEEIDMGLVSLLIMIFGVSTTYLDKLMPDYLSFILVQIGIGLSWKKPKYIYSFLLCSLGLLIKPTSVICFAIILLKRKGILKEVILWVFPAILAALLYYTLGVDHLRNLSDVPEYFKVSMGNPFSNLINFLEKPKDIFILFRKSIFSSYFIFIIPILYLLEKLRNSKIRFNFKVWGLLCLQILAIAFLDGNHSLIHHYYFIGTSVLGSMIIISFFHQLDLPKLEYLLLTILLGTQIEQGFYNLKSYFKKNYQPECRKILSYGDFSKVLRIRTSFSSYPTIGLCVGKIQNSKITPYGVFLKGEIIPDDCKLFGSTENLQLVKCETKNL